jgi:hypothetical protein
VKRTSKYYANAFLTFVIAFLILPTNSLLSENPTFYAIRGINQITATFFILVTLILLWLCSLTVFTFFNKVDRHKTINLQISNIFLGLTFLYLLYNALSLNIESVNVSPIRKVLIVAIGITLYIFLNKITSEKLTRTILFSLLLAMLIQTSITSPFAIFNEKKSTADYLVDDATPSILLVIADEASYWGMMNESGVARPGLKNISELQKQSTTYTDTYAVTANTDYAIPAILNGVADVVNSKELFKPNSKLQYGLFPDEKAGFDRFFHSEILDDPCIAEGTNCNGSPNEGRYIAFLKDFWTIVAKNNLIGLRRYFPSVTERSKNYWSDLEINSEENNLIEFILNTSASTRPKFMFYHSLSTHNPWNKDHSGNILWEEKYSDLGEFNSRELVSLRKQMYFESFLQFDVKLGKILKQLKMSNLFDNTMIIITADHGVSFNDQQSLGISIGDKSRQGVDEFQMWNEVAHIPLIIKYPNQKDHLTIVDRKSQSSIAKTIVNNLNGVWVSEYEASEDLVFDHKDRLIFADTTKGIDDKLRWELDSKFEKVDPWIESDLLSPLTSGSILTFSNEVEQLRFEGYTNTEFTFESLSNSEQNIGLIRIESNDPYCGDSNGNAILVGDEGKRFKVVFERSGIDKWKNIGWAIIATPNAPPILYCKK